MLSKFQKYKGIHPGKIIARELEKRSIKQRPFALSLMEHPQTFNAMLMGRRGISTALALKIEKEFQLEEGTLAILQTYFDIQKLKEKEKQDTPNLEILNKSLFWDTDIKRMNWERQYKAVIQRVFERGSELEKDEISRFYGPEKVKEALKESTLRNAYTVYKRNK